MSTYCSDPSLESLAPDTPGLVDVAYDCLGRDVRIIVDGRAVYVTSEVARVIAASIIRQANRADQIDPDDPWGPPDDTWCCGTCEAIARAGLR